MRIDNAEEYGGRVDAVIAAHRAELIAFACELVAAASPNPPGDERAAAAVAERRLARLGFYDCRILGPRPERANLICRYDTGRPGRTLLLNGHLDTKPAGDLAAWRSDPYQPTIRDGYLYGLGAADMKGPDAALAYGLAAAVAAAADKMAGQVLLVLSADEEGQVLDGARYLVQDVGLRADAALIAEPCGIRRPWQMIPLISRGFCAVRFMVQGTPTHSSIGDQLGAVNASLEIGRLLLFLHEHLRFHHPATPLCPQGPTANLGATLRGGQALAIVPPTAEFTADIRTLPGMTKASVAADIEVALAEFRLMRPGVGVTWEFSAGNLAWTEPTQTSPDEPLVTALQGASAAVLGQTPPLGCFPGGTDAIWWQGVGRIPTVPGFGPGMLSNCHQPNECIALEEIVQAARIYGRAILMYLSES